MMKKKILIIVCSISLFACQKRTDHFYSNDGKECISIITNKNIRYVIEGYYNDVPEKNYVKLDIGKIDRHVGDEIVGCWNFSDRDWKIMMNDVIVLENKLDKSKFIFENKFPVDSIGVPTLEKYNNKKGCFNIVYDYYSLVSTSGDLTRK